MRHHLIVAACILSMATVSASQAQAYQMTDSLKAGEAHAGSMVGGQYTAGGWEVTARTDLVWFALPTLVEGSIEFTVLNVTTQNLVVNDNEIFGMYEAGYGASEPIAYSPLFRENDFKCMIRIYGQAETGRTGAQKVMWGICPGGAPGHHAGGCPCGQSFFDEPFGGDTAWDGSPQRLRIEWKDGHTRYLRNGGIVLDIDWSGAGVAYGPQSLHFSLGTPRAAAVDSSGMPVGAVFSDVAVEGTEGPPAACGGATDAGTPDSGPGQDAGTPVARTFEPVADTFADPADPAATHGSDFDLRVGGDGAGGEGRTIYLRFDVTGTAGVSAARLFMKDVNAGGGGAIHVVKDNGWSEAGLNWDNRPAHEAAALSQLGAVAAGQVYSWDVTSAIAGDGLYSFAITSTDDDGSWWDSRESSGMRPYLEVTTGGGGTDGGTPDGGQVVLPSVFSVHPSDPRHFAYDEKPFFFAGRSAFTILARDDAQMQAFVDESAADGFSQFRVWLMWKRDPAWANGAVAADIWPFGGTIDAPDFGTLNTALFDKLGRLLAMMAQKGIVAEVSPFLCAMDYAVGFDNALKMYVDEVARRLAGHANAYFEVANEYNHGCFTSGGLPEQFVRDAAARFSAGAPATLVTVSGGGSMSPSFAGEGWMDVLNYHLDRNDTWWLNPWTVFPQNLGWNKPQVSDEPTGSATQEEYDAWYKDYMGGLGRDTNADHFRWAMYIAAVSGGYFTLHAHKGITAETGPSPGKEFVMPLRGIFETRVDHWLVEPDGSLVKDCGAAQCFSAAAGAQRLLYVLDGAGGQVTFDAGAGDRVNAWIDPRTGNVTEEWEGAGGTVTLTVPAGQDAFFVSKPKVVEPPDAGTPDGGGTGDGGTTSDGGGTVGDGGGTPAGDGGGGGGGADGSAKADASTGSAGGGEGGCSCATLAL